MERLKCLPVNSENEKLSRIYRERNGTNKADTFNINKLVSTFKVLKESINSDGHQFHQYQQNKQSPLILTELTVSITKEHNV